ncbi:11262_t:CDS:1, partial [Paraglomus occultum]
MDQPPPSSQKRTLLEDNIPDISTGGAPDHQSKRIRITLPPPVSLISPTQQ